MYMYNISKKYHDLHVISQVVAVKKVVATMKEVMVAIREMKRWWQ